MDKETLIIQEIKEKLADLCGIDVTNDYTKAYYKDENWGVDFEEWLYNKLLTEKDYREFLLRFPTRNKKMLAKAAGEFQAFFWARSLQNK